jgi:TolB-like protein
MSIEDGFRIGSRSVLPLECRVTTPEGDLRVEPKAMAVLVELARRAPAVCTREQIIQRVWPRGFVSDDVLTRCIGQVRRALGDDSRAPTCLETIPKRGYRLRVPVIACETAGVLASPTTPKIESLIVLPFQKLSAAAEDFIADGLTELLILRLAAFRGIRVISRTTAMQFKGSRADIPEIAARTGADWVVEGSVLQSADRLQIVVQLIDARTDAHIWAADYVRDLQELLPLQNEIARRVAESIRLQLGVTPEAPSAAPPIASPLMRSYLRGRHLISKRTVPNLREAMTDFLDVTAQAQEYAPAWASLAECEMLLAHYGAPDQQNLIADCDSHLERALTLDPDLAIGLSTRGAARFFFRCDLAGATTDLERALMLLPSYALAMLSLANVCVVRHEFDNAAGWIDQALLVDPLDVGLNMNLGDHRILRRQYGGAVQALERALELAPQHRPSQLRLGWALALSGDLPSATKLLAGIGPNGETDSQWHEYSALVAAAGGTALIASKHYAAMQDISGREIVPAWTLARAAAAADFIEAALGHLEAAARAQSSSLPFLMVTPAFDALHADPRFQALGARLGLSMRATLTRRPGARYG